MSGLICGFRKPTAEALVGLLGNGPIRNRNDRRRDGPWQFFGKVADDIETGDTGSLEVWDLTANATAGFTIPVLSRSGIAGGESVVSATRDGQTGTWVLDESNGTPLVVFTLVSDLSGSGTVAATVVSDSSGELDPGATIAVNALLDYDADGGSSGVAAKIGPAYVVIELSQGSTSTSSVSTPLIHGLINSRSGSPYGALQSDSTAYVKTSSLTAISAGYTFTPFTSCTNPFKLNGAEDDICIIGKMGSGDFFLIAIIPQKAPIFFSAGSDRIEDGTYFKFSVNVEGYNGPGEPPTVVWDLHNIAYLLKTSRSGFAEWNQNAGKWVITSCERPTLWIRGQVQDEFTDQPDDFEIINIVGIDGKPPSGPLTVKNTFKAEQADAYAEVLAMWNDDTEEWEGRVACPAMPSP